MIKNLLYLQTWFWIFWSSFVTPVSFGLDNLLCISFSINSTKLISNYSLFMTRQLCIPPVFKQLARQHPRGADHSVCLVQTFNHFLQGFLSIQGKSGDQTNRETDPPENCHLNVKKLPKTWLIFFKLPKICHCFTNITNGNFLTFEW